MINSGDTMPATTNSTLDVSSAVSMMSLKEAVASRQAGQLIPPSPPRSLHRLHSANSAGGALPGSPGKPPRSPGMKQLSLGGANAGERSRPPSGLSSARGAGMGMAAEGLIESTTARLAAALQIQVWSYGLDHTL